jgi:hypothetical protein
VRTDIGMQLGEIAKANPAVRWGAIRSSIRSYGPNTNVVLRAPMHISSHKLNVRLKRVRWAQSSG